ncbi:hypothetical protein MA16_Dca010701 [Dendrobium catenatum]|uniref:Uncharacterized protein n=1 Tax=Dendrobium catenatum TaxID=906689 RepID=A0A2I0VK89_9ASPA|nr:hypothetical protein MA16_Dca010701 [Dendrobium catenatum]
MSEKPEVIVGNYKVVNDVLDVVVKDPNVTATMVSHNSLHCVSPPLDRSPQVNMFLRYLIILIHALCRIRMLVSRLYLLVSRRGVPLWQGFVPVALAIGLSEPDMNSPMGVVNCNNPDMFDVGVKLLDGDVSSLSPNAIPFIPSCLVDGFCPSDVILDSLEVGLVAEFDSAPVIGANSLAEGGRRSGGSSVLGVVEPNGCGQVFDKSDGDAAVNLSVEYSPVVFEAEPPSYGIREECMPLVNRLIDVPVNEIDTQAMTKCLGDPSEVEIREQLNWLNVSSDGELESDSSEGDLVSDDDNDFSLVCTRPSLTGATRGRFWGRGRCKR